MALWNPTAYHLVGSCVSHKICRAQERFEGSGIRPPPIKDAIRQSIFLQVHVVDVGDFELIPPARPGLADLFKDCWIVEINSGHSIVRLRDLWLLFNGDNLAIGHFGAPKAFRIIYLL